jgi:hypothetical protein
VRAYLRTQRKKLREKEKEALGSPSSSESSSAARAQHLDIDYDLNNDTSLAAAKERTWRNERHHTWPNFLDKLQENEVFDKKSKIAWQKSGIAQMGQFDETDKMKLKEKEKEVRMEEELAKQTQEQHEKAMMEEVMKGMADLEKEMAKK